MRACPLFACIALAGLLASPSISDATTVTDPTAARATQGAGPVQVQWEDPSGFTEIRHSHNRFEAQRGDWVRQLAEYLQGQAARALAPGERLQVLITDIKRAGEYEAVGTDMRDVRVVRDIYPPRMALSFMRHGANREMLEQGSRLLRDPGFLSATIRSDHDPLRYEKRMIDDWVRREFGPARDSTGER